MLPWVVSRICARADPQHLGTGRPSFRSTRNARKELASAAVLDLENAEQFRFYATAGGANPSLQDPASSKPEKLRRTAAVATIVLASVTWIGGLISLGLAQTGLPWCITLAATAGSAILSPARKARVLISASLHSAERQPVSFVESCACTYLAVSLLFFAWIVYHRLVKAPPITVTRQIVDIQLTSIADFQDKHELLPGTEAQESMRKRNSPAPVSSQGSLTAQSAPESVTARSQEAAEPAAETRPDGERAAISTPDRKTEPRAATPRQPAGRRSASQKLSPFKLTTPPARAVATAAEAEQFLLRSPPPTISPQATAAPAASRPSEGDNRPFMEEVSPPEMVELVDNDGDNSLHIWQPGGRSPGGTGSRSGLMDYLKELNRRIKAAWMPPRGESRQVEILFRIRKGGQLSMVKVVRTSGNPEADEAAIKSILGSAPFKQLPADYSMNYLDIRYSFNYNVDQLSEITGRAVH